jgi:thiamine kinase-like enzyme
MTQMIMQPAPPTMASPSWWGADSERQRLVPPSGSTAKALFLKTMLPHSRAYVDIRTSFTAAVAAGQADIGPYVVDADIEAGTLRMEDLSPTSKTATLNDFQDPSNLQKLVELRRKVGLLAVESPRSATVFDDLQALQETAAIQRVRLPDDFPWMLRILDSADTAIAATGYDLRFCHGDGNISNVLIDRTDGALRLVDWDCAAKMDPIQDLGVMLAELAPFDLDAREIFEMYWGSWDRGLFERSRIYAIADAVRWGLIGAYVDAVDPGTYEYSKFSDWQFLRARIWLNDPHLDDRLRNL